MSDLRTVDRVENLVFTHIFCKMYVYKPPTYGTYAIVELNEIKKVPAETLKYARINNKNISIKYNNDYAHTIKRVM